MRISFVSRAAAAALIVGAIMAGSGAARAESVMAACASQWKEAQAAGTTGGATWAEFLARCKTQAARPSPSAPQPAPAPTQAANGESVMAVCASQWKEAKAAGTTGGATWPEFLARCRRQGGGTSSAGAPPAPQPAPAPGGGSSFPWWQPSRNAAPAPTGAGQFRTEAEAGARCPADKVVWVNTVSKIYHYQGARWYAHTRQGAYMCEADAKAAGDRAARSIFGRRQS